jgi:hypothetical protein
MSGDYSGVAEDGRWLGRAGWGLFSLGVVVAAVGAAIPLLIAVIVVLYSIALRDF